MDFETTIVAVSSPHGNSPRALIRACGNNIFESSASTGVKVNYRKLTSCNIEIPEGTLPILCMAYPAQHSYVGQDTLEIMLPNNRFVIDSVVRKLIEVTDGRYAEAGEFTARAFFNGKMSLSEAEGVCATISANNDCELRGAALLREGVLNSLVIPISQTIAKTLALVEAGIDFTDEEDVVAISLDNLHASIESAYQSIESILKGKIAMTTLQHLPNVVIAGAPNAGKSTLFNALLGRNRVVVSDIAGTTRDAIQEHVWFGAKEALLIDIAGFEEANTQLGVAAQDSAQRMVERADIVLWCIAPGETEPIADSSTLFVYTKSDLRNEHPHNEVCSLLGTGLDQLQATVEEKLFSIPLPTEDALAILPRHEQHLQSTASSLQEAREHCSVPELTAASLREALNSIGSISGAVTPDEVLGEVFASFCVGK